MGRSAIATATATTTVTSSATTTTTTSTTTTTTTIVFSIKVVIFYRSHQVGNLVSCIPASTSNRKVPGTGELERSLEQIQIYDPE